MQRFGIEIRKIGDMGTLYKDVDLILKNASIPSGEVSKSVQVLTVAHSLQKMLNTQNFFDVCTIKKCCEVCDVCISRERMSVYTSIHCLSWNEMTPEYRQMITAMVLDDFRDVLN